ncbi:hypothetical protein LCGC14_3072740, partial [marine sediment metagenome]
MMQTDKLFAPSVDYNDEGLLMFENDVGLRRRFFGYKVDHPAHNNMHMLRDMVQFTTEPGDMICDPMAGAGSMFYTVADEETPRKLVLIELGEYFSEKLIQNREDLISRKHIKSENVLIFPESDCIDILNLKTMKEHFQLICFSPPYADQLQIRSGHAIYDQREGQEGTAGIGNFTYDHPMNLGNMDEFKFNLNMRSV